MVVLRGWTPMSVVPLYSGLSGVDVFLRAKYPCMVGLRGWTFSYEQGTPVWWSYRDRRRPMTEVSLYGGPLGLDVFL